MEKTEDTRVRQNRNTRQKRMILDCLIQNNRHHLTVEDILALLKSRGETVGKATVYRYVKQLEKDHLIRRYDIAGSSGACYQYIGEESSCNDLHHYHLVCNVCGGVAHVESNLLQPFFDKVLRSNRFTVDERKTAFYGVCGTCSKSVTRSLQ